MVNEYKTVRCFGTGELKIRKSRFIAYVQPADTEKEALEFIEDIKQKHRDATHNVFAYLIGLDREIQKFSDDGEPNGTAGKPILEVIKKESLKNVVVVVTRYFGGILLGAGGLVRAYTKGAKVGIENAQIVNKVLHYNYKLKTSYSLLGKIQNHIINMSQIIYEVSYGQDVSLGVYVKYNKKDFFEKVVMEVTSGQVNISNIGESYISFQQGKAIL